MCWLHHEHFLEMRGYDLARVQGVADAPRRVPCLASGLRDGSESGLTSRRTQRKAKPMRNEFAARICSIK